MRKITEQAANAFQARTRFCMGNTHVSTTPHGVELFLHGNLIASFHEDQAPEDQLVFTMQSWSTPTTRERLKGLGIRICQRDGEQFYKGVAIDPEGYYFASDGAPAIWNTAKRRYVRALKG